MLSVFSDDYFMKKALQEAATAASEGEVPVGAVIVCNNVVIAKAYNQVEKLGDITAHAEMLAITAATNYLGSKYLHDCTLFVSLEPCVMCAGAAYWARLGRVVYGASDDKGGFMRYGKELLHKKTKLEFGIGHQESSDMLKTFFENRR